MSGCWQGCAAPLGVDDVLQAGAHVALAQGREAEARAARLQRRDDLADVVADQAEARVARVLLDHCARRRAAAPRQHSVKLSRESQADACGKTSGS